jgi:hypothetical protein
MGINWHISSKKLLCTFSLADFDRTLHNTLYEYYHKFHSFEFVSRPNSHERCITAHSHWREEGLAWKVYGVIKYRLCSRLYSTYKNWVVSRKSLISYTVIECLQILCPNITVGPPLWSEVTGSIPDGTRFSEK